MTVKAIDSPLENLALYKAIANLTGTDRTITVAVPASKDGTTPATTLTWTLPTSINIDLLKATLLAAAGGQDRYDLSGYGDVQQCDRRGD